MVWLLNLLVALPQEQLPLSNDKAPATRPFDYVWDARSVSSRSWHGALRTNSRPRLGVALRVQGRIVTATVLWLTLPTSDANTRLTARAAAATCGTSSRRS